jgi:peptidoglycan/xylan/chitin deacetylase (PgdA/CDA1 family)
MSAAGITFGAHACTHRDLTRLTAAEVEDEMAGSKAVIEDRLGVAVRGFAYPFGRFDARSHAIARRHFAFACADTLGFASATSDPWALPRVETYYLRGRRTVALVASPWLATYLAARRGPRAVRRAIERATRRA